MEKIPTLFIRDPANMARVTREVTPGCEWVLTGEGIPTRKWDGTNIRVTIAAGRAVGVEKRRNPTRDEKAAGAEPGYVPASRDDSADKHIFAAVDATSFVGVPDGSWSGEALGPKIQGGPDKTGPTVVLFGVPGWADSDHLESNPRTFDNLSGFLATLAIEGIVWHHPDGRMAKVKARDFGHRWPR